MRPTTVRRTQPTRRRENGLGAISYDSTAGCWIGLLGLGRDENGHRQRTKVRGKTRTEVRDKLDGLEVPTVSVDHAAGMRAIADHLSELGHRRVTYLSGPTMSAASKERFVALIEAAVNRFELHEIAAGAQFEDGFRAVERIVATGATAVVGYNDLVAYGAMARMHELGIAVLTPSA